MAKAASSDFIVLPKGGGALHGIGEKFAPDLHTGTGNFTIPITLPSGRSGFQPELNLVYSTGNGNGPFGLGWTLSIPGVSRKTSKGVPRYDDAKDVFILSGAEDLVLLPHDPQDPVGVTNYRPRTEGLFARIQRHLDAGNDYWEVRSKNGLLSLYGKHGIPVNGPAVIADPADRRKIFAWKLTQTQDPFGNRIEYEYERDTGHDGPHHWDQLYLSEIRYVDHGDPSSPQFLVKVQLIYEQRPDPFSEYRSGFEIRTTLRCTHIKVLTDAGRERRTRTYHLEYLDRQSAQPEDISRNRVSLLTRVRVEGHDDSATLETDRSEWLPPLEFDYTRFEPQKRQYTSLTGQDRPAASLANPDLELVDLFGNGLPDILEMNGTVRYWRNLGGGQFDLARSMPEAPAGVALADAGVQLLDANGDGRTDLLVTKEGLSGYYSLKFGGLWDRKPFRRYQQAPSFNLEDPEVKLMDLDGDGVIDALRSGSTLECFFNDPQKGWNRTQRMERKALEDFPDVNFSDSRVKLADMTGDWLQDIVLIHNGRVDYWPNLGHGQWGKRTSMRNSPRFEDAGTYGTIGYDPKRILLGDVDGDGVADLVYIGSGHITVWINQSGNSWSDPIPIHGTPPITDPDAVRLADVYGAGTAGILWTLDYRTDRDAAYKFLDLTGGVKPYLLNRMDNHMGAVTQVGYASSTQFYLRDQRDPDKRWRTPLPFPVQVVARVEVIDALSKGKLTTEYRYHHGYWDGAEREFRGFGMVEQLDTEIFNDFNRAGLHDGETRFEKFLEAEGRQQFFSAPILTKTWFHQGPVGDEFGEWAELDQSAEYWRGDPQLLGHTQKVNAYLDEIKDRRIKRDALRALRGSILRTELYALDGSAQEERPYTVTEYAYGVREEKPVGEANSAAPPVFFPFRIAQRTTQWERGDDPMTQFTFTGTYDDFGQPLSQTSIAMPRRSSKRLKLPRNQVADETRILATHTRTVYAKPAQGSNAYIHDRVAHTTSLELVEPPEVNESDSTNLAQVLQAQKAAALAVHHQFEHDFEDWSPEGATPDLYRIYAHTVNRYDATAYQGEKVTEIGQHGALTLSETLVFTDSILKEAYLDDPLIDSSGKLVLPPGTPAGLEADLHYRRAENEAGYVPGFYSKAKQQKFDVQDSDAKTQCGLVIAQRDPRDNETTIEHELPYALLPSKVIAPITALVTKAENDYRVLQPRKLIEANDNWSEVRFSALGLSLETWVKGKNGEGDHARPSVRLAYDFLAFHQSPPEARKPISVRTVRHCHHDTETDVLGEERNKTIETCEYSDGFGRLLQTRTQGEDVRFGHETFGGGQTILPAQQGDGAGETVEGRTNGDATKANVIVSGWQRYDNKGRVVEKYEPFFDVGWDYDPPDDTQLGQKATMLYDPRGQVVRTVNPDGSEQRVIYGVPNRLDDPSLGPLDTGKYSPTPWEAYTYDSNDLAPVSCEPDEKLPDGSPKPLRDRAPEHHHFTPSSILIDALGRTLLSIERNRAKPASHGAPLKPIQDYRTRSVYDIQGNLLIVQDALGRDAFKHVYDLTKRPLRIESIDAGVRRMALDVAGNEVQRRDSKGAITLRTYDPLSRPSQVWARNHQDMPLTLREHLKYGDDSDLNQDQAARDANPRKNRLGKLYQHLDEGGKLTFEEYDFKGNLLEKQRQVIADKIILDALNAGTGPAKVFVVDWNQPPALEGEHRTSTTYDALSRIKTLTHPQDVEGQRKQLTPRYNRAGALESVNLDDGAYVEHIAYNAKGQRVLIAYGNSVMTRYAYDPRTFRLMRMRTERYAKPSQLRYQPDGGLLQDFAYTYDLVGNIRRITERVSGCGIKDNPEALENPELRTELAAGDALVRKFEYDPLYRLTLATGRESTNIGNPRPWEDLAREGFNSWKHGTANQDNAPELTQRYHEEYAYDPAGNKLSLKHSGGWTRHFGMAGFTPKQWRERVETFLAGGSSDFGDGGNRLTNFGAGDEDQGQTHGFDPNGNLIREFTSRHFAWDHADRLIAFATRPENGDTASTEACYLYDAGGQRVKKLVRKGANDYEVTVYLDGVFEHHRLSKAGKPPMENNILHVSDNQSRIASVRVGEACPKDGAADKPVQYHLGDHLGSSHIVIAGTIATTANEFMNREECFPYGETSFGSFARKRYRFTGKERDEESGLYYHGARYYAPWLSCWLSAEPLIVDYKNYRTYAFVYNNPQIAIDPDGRHPILVIIGVAFLLDILISNVANAPAPNTKMIPKVTEAEFLAQSAVTLATGGVGTAVGKQIVAKTGSGILGGALGGGIAGGLGAVGSVAVNDAANQQLSSPNRYIRAGREGMAVGVLIGGVAGAASSSSLNADSGRSTPSPRVVNLGGELESKPGDIVINKSNTAQVPLTTIAKETGAIVIEGRAEAIPLKTSSIDIVEGHNFPPNTIDWNQASREIARVLKPGGTVDLSVRGGEAKTIASELEKHGIRATVDPLSNSTRVTGVKPKGK
jgi:RHS repeat-associated protein